MGVIVDRESQYNLRLIGDHFEMLVTETTAGTVIRMIPRPGLLIEPRKGMTNDGTEANLIVTTQR